MAGVGGAVGGKWRQCTQITIKKEKKEKYLRRLSTTGYEGISFDWRKIENWSYILLLSKKKKGCILTSLNNLSK